MMNSERLVRWLLVFLMPPLAVLHWGCGLTLLVTLLTLFGWFPGVILAALIMLYEECNWPTRWSRFVRVPAHSSPAEYTPPEKEKRKREDAWIRLADGEIAQVADDDGELPDAWEKPKRDQRFGQ